jgi:hypothetical protein
MGSLAALRVREGYRICEDVLVYFWNNHYDSRNKTWGANTGLTSAPFTNVVTRWNGWVESLCPVLGRFVYFANDGDELENNRIVVADLF